MYALSRLAWPLVALLAVAAAHAGSLTLVRAGQPQATIVLADRPCRAAQFAAYELQWHIQQITGATLPIVPEGQAAAGVKVYVGESRATRRLGLYNASLGKQEYVIRFLPEALALVGRDKVDRTEVKYSPRPTPEALATWPDMWDETGTMTAVYDFLERCCNVRWFGPSEVGLDCPRTATLSVSGPDVRRAPRFRYRYASYMLGEAYDKYTLLQPKSEAEWKQYEAEAYPEVTKLAGDWWKWVHAKRGYVQLFRYRMREGGEICPGNHSLYGYYDRFYQKNPQQPELFEGSRPLWFAQGYEGRPPQMCYTNRGLIEQVAQDACEFFTTGKKYPGSQAGGDFFCVEPMDNASFCQCPSCQSLIRRTRREEPNGVYSRALDSDYFFNFVNEVAKLVRVKHPDKFIVTLAYMTHAYPPASFQLEPNVAVQYCWASNRMPYATAEYENDRRAFLQWAQQAGARPLYLWLYYTFPVEIAVNGKFRAFPGFFAHTLDQQMKLFDRYGYRGFFHCGYGQEVEAYLTYKLMDDPAQNVDQLLNEYFSRYYGPAGAALRRLYLDIEQVYCNPANWPEKPGHMTVQIAWGKLGTPERMARYEQWMAEAKRLATAEPYRQRVRLFELSTWEYMKQGSDQYQARRAAHLPAVTAPRVAEAGGDPARVDWGKAVALGSFHVRGGQEPAPRKLTGRLAHDGRWLYLELADPCDPKRLVISPGVYPCDDWELFVAGQKALPYRQFAVGPSGTVVATSNGEVNWRMNEPMLDHGIRATSDTTGPGQWVTRLAIPLASLTAGGAQAGGKVYLNIVRVTNSELSGTGGLGIDSWVSYSTVHTVDRLGEVTLQ